MAKYESVNLLFKLLIEARYPLSKQQLQEKLECSAATVERYLTELRDTYGQKVEYLRESKGYRLLNESGNIELPSHLFSSQEINAILLVDQLINDLEPGFLKNDLRSVKQHLSRIKNKFSNRQTFSEKRIRMLNIGKRVNKNNHLTAITQAVLNQKIIVVEYDSRTNSDNPILSRILSPQRLTHYRDNWYLDAWCHERGALRTFALERIIGLKEGKTAKQKIVSLSDKELDSHYTKTFGIFGGEISGIAKLKFTPHRSQWVSEEVWHQDQVGIWLEDGSYQLEIPYGNDLELIGDILKYGNQVEVLEPRSLREKIKLQIQKLTTIYL